MRVSPTGIILACAILFVAGHASTEEIASVQLVGNFHGITCEPDTANDMELVAPHQWCRLRFINEPEDPDTIYFKFTKNYAYYPSHWGWSGVWGVARYDWDPPSIAKVLPDSGYYYFRFNDTSYVYSIERPAGSIGGVIESGTPSGVPDNMLLVLFDSSDTPVWHCTSFPDSTFLIEHLPPATYDLAASAPGYNDTMVSDIVLDDGELEWIALRMTPTTAVFITSASCERANGGITLRWSTSCSPTMVGFDVYRGTEPLLQTMDRRTESPVYASGDYCFFDQCKDPRLDYYYYLVEVNDDNPTRYGPLFIAGSIPGLRSGLGQNYPNPFNPATIIPFAVGSDGADREVTIAFFDVAGRQIDRFNLGPKPVGEYTFRWNPALSAQGSIPSGVYYCRLQVGKEAFTRKLILLR